MPSFPHKFSEPTLPGFSGARSVHGDNKKRLRRAQLFVEILSYRFVSSPNCRWEPIQGSFFSVLNNDFCSLASTFFSSLTSLSGEPCANEPKPSFTLVIVNRSLIMARLAIAWPTFTHTHTRARVAGEQENEELSYDEPHLEHVGITRKKRL